MLNVGKKTNTNEIIRKHRFHIKKHLGQNFLVDQGILNKIITHSDLKKDSFVCEIGAGLGALTELLCKSSKKVLTFEIDDQLIPILKENLTTHKNIKVINKDFLKCDFASEIHDYLGKKSKITVVANLPYYITTAILSKLIESDLNIDKIIVMMQYEVAARICSKPSTKDYNSLSVITQFKTNPKIAFKVPRTVFFPPPNVDSAVVVLDVLDNPKFKIKNEQFFYKFVRGCFTQRRKTLTNNLSAYLSTPKSYVSNKLIINNFDPNIRSEALELKDFVDLANIFYIK